MATKQVTAVTANYDLGDAGTGDVTTKVIHFTFSTLVGSFVIQGRLMGTTRTFVPIPYRRRYLNGAVGDETFVSTAITADSLVEVNAAGIEVRASYTHTSGAGPGAIDYVDLNG